MWRPCARTAKVVDKQLEYGLKVEAKMLLRPGSEDWVGASLHGAAVGVFFLCPCLNQDLSPYNLKISSQVLLSNDEVEFIRGREK